MTPEECLRQNDLEAALSLLQDQVRKAPADAEKRVFLFQLLAVMGQWERAMTQMKVAGDLDESTLAMKVMYAQVLNCEALREQVFAGTHDPVIFGKPGEWVGLLIQALKATATQQWDQAEELRNRAFEMAPAITGELNGERFEWIADADTRLGPVVEAIIEGRYLWVPFENIRSISIEPPEDLRDLVWLPANFNWVNGGESYGLIPTRYPDSYSAGPELALARKTEWVNLAPDHYKGLGQRILATDAGDYALMDIRTISLDSESPTEDGDGQESD